MKRHAGKRQPEFLVDYTTHRTEVRIPSAQEEDLDWEMLQQILVGNCSPVRYVIWAVTEAPAPENIRDWQIAACIAVWPRKDVLADSGDEDAEESTLSSHIGNSDASGVIFSDDVYAQEEDGFYQQVFGMELSQSARTMLLESPNLSSELEQNSIWRRWEIEHQLLEASTPICFAVFFRSVTGEIYSHFYCFEKLHPGVELERIKPLLEENLAWEAAQPS